MLRVVVDTNCLLASINPRGAYFALYELFVANAFEWVLSNEILTEYEEQVTRRCYGLAGTRYFTGCPQYSPARVLLQMAAY